MGHGLARWTSSPAHSLSDRWTLVVRLLVNLIIGLGAAQGCRSQLGVGRVEGRAIAPRSRVHVMAPPAQATRARCSSSETV